ncbi:unnamed protein product, partial [Scytosiphon promiscuus]
MAHCRLALLVHLTLVVILCLAPCAPAVASDDLSLASQDFPAESRQGAQPGPGVTTRHGMTRKGPGASVAALGSAVAGTCSRTLRDTTQRSGWRWHSG